MNKNNYIHGNVPEKSVTTAHVPEIPNVIELLQKDASQLAEEVAILFGRLEPVTSPATPEVACEQCKTLERHGLLKPLHELRESIASSTNGLRDLRSRLMI